MVSIIQLPPEILERIIGFIEKPRHLLPLALSSRIFYSVIIPDHIQNRHVRSYARDSRQWDYLLSHPRQASFVHTLEIIPEPEPQKRSGQLHRMVNINPYSRTLGVHLLAAALPLMVNLVRFSWTDESLGNTAFRRVIEGIRKSLFNLREINLQGRPYKGIAGLSIRELEMSLAIQPERLLDLRRLKIEHTSNGAFYPRGILESVINLPGKSLTHLFIYQLSRPLPNFFNFDIVHFPLLQKLTLHIGNTADIFGTINDREEMRRIVYRFLKRHSELEALSLFGAAFTGVVTLPANTMVKLRSVGFQDLSLHSDRNRCIPKDVMERLWYTTFNHTISTLPQIFEMKSLRFCTFSDPNPMGDNLENLWRVAPQLERLSYRLRMIDPERRNNYNSANKNHNILLKFKTLTHLGHLWSPYHPSEVLMKMLCEIPNLTYVESRQGWIQIVRRQDGTYLAHYRLVDDSQVKTEAWGGFYSGESE